MSNITEAGSVNYKNCKSVIYRFSLSLKKCTQGYELKATAAFARAVQQQQQQQQQQHLHLLQLFFLKCQEKGFDIHQRFNWILQFKREEGGLSPKLKRGRNAAIKSQEV